MPLVPALLTSPQTHLEAWRMAASKRRPINDDGGVKQARSSGIITPTATVKVELFQDYKPSASLLPGSPADELLVQPAARELPLQQSKMEPTAFQRLAASGPWGRRIITRSKARQQSDQLPTVQQQRHSSVSSLTLEPAGESDAAAQVLIGDVLDEYLTLHQAARLSAV